DVRVRNRIEMPVLGSSLLTDPALAHLVDRSPTAQERKPICTGTHFRGSKLDCLSEPIDATLDLRMRNMSITQTRGFDIHARFARETDLGRFQFEAIGNYILDYAQAPTSAHDMRDLVDTQHQPPEFRARFRLAWNRGSWSAEVMTHYSDRYHDSASNPPRYVRSWRTHDVSFTYRFNENQGPWLNGLSLTLAGENIAVRDPPFLNSSLGFDA